MTAAASALARTRPIARGHCCHLGVQFNSRTSSSRTSNLSIVGHQMLSAYEYRRAACGSRICSASARHPVTVRSVISSNTGTGPSFSYKSHNFDRQCVSLSHGGFKIDVRKHQSCAASDAAVVEEELEHADNMAADSLDLDIKEAFSMPKTRVVVRDHESLERKKRAIRAAGPQKLQVVSDFDMTLTGFNVNGKKGQSESVADSIVLYSRKQPSIYIEISYDTFEVHLSSSFMFSLVKRTKRV